MRIWDLIVWISLWSVAGCGDAPLQGGELDGIGADFAVADALPEVGPEDAADAGTEVPDISDGDGGEVLDAVEDGLDGSEPDADAETVGDADASGDTPVGPCTPVPFVAPGSPTGWKHTSTELFTVTQGKANHRGQDVVATADGPQVLIGKFAYGIFDKDLKEEDVEVFIQPDGPCSDWVSLGVVETTQEGDFGTQYGIEDDGGRVFVELTGAQRLGVGVHPVRMLVHGDHSVAAFNVFVFEPGTQAVLFDIDGTLTTDDMELVSQLATEIFNGTYVPEFHDGALDATKAWIDKGYQLIYLTARPDFLKVMTLDSIILPGFPVGVTHFTDTNTQFISDVAPYKAEFLQRVLDAGVDIVAAYGNADTDVEAYEDAGLDKKRTFIIGEHAGMAGTVPLSDYPGHHPWIEAYPDATSPAPQPQAW